MRNGRIVRVITGKGETQRPEHFWLCGPCYEEYNFVFRPGGDIALDVKPRVQQSNEFRFAEVILAETA